MSRRFSIRARAWSALLLPPVAWFLFEQGLSALVHARCDAVVVGILWGMGSLLLCAVAVRIAWSLKHHGGELANPWLAHLAICGTGIFGLAILFQTLALSLVPSCVG